MRRCPDPSLGGLGFQVRLESVFFLFSQTKMQALLQRLRLESALLPVWPPTHSPQLSMNAVPLHSPVQSFAANM